MTLLRRVVPVLVAVAVAFLGLTGSQAQAADEFIDRTVSVAPTVTTFGSQVVVTGTGWPGGALLQAVPCGNGGFNGSADCASSAAVTTTTTGEGDFFVDLLVADPGKPCPCVVKVDVIDAGEVSGAASLSVASPIVITDADEGPIEVDDFSRELTIAASIGGFGPWTSWFGGRASRTLTFDVTNTGPQPVLNPPTTVTFGASSAPTDVVAQPELGSLAPGETKTYSVPIEIDAVALGKYTALVTIRGLSSPASASVQTSVIPWGWVLIAFLLLQIPLLGLYRRDEPIIETPDEAADFAPPVTDDFAAGIFASSITEAPVPSDMDANAPASAPPGQASAVEDVRRLLGG
jgi:hypothetical protein